MFFQVEPELVDIPIHDHLDRLLRDYLPSLPPPSVTFPDTDQERTPFMKFMKWDRHLSCFRTNPSKIKLILSLQNAPTSEEGDLSRLTVAVKEYIRLGMKICEGHSQSYNVQTILMHGRNIPSGKDQHHWTPLPENGSPDKYAATICYLSRYRSRMNTLHEIHEMGSPFVLFPNRPIEAQAYFVPTKCSDVRGG